MGRERDKGYGGWDLTVNRDRDYSTRRRGGEMELYDRDRDRERERERPRVNIRDKREYSPRHRGGGGYERMNIDGKYSQGRGGVEFEMQRMKGKDDGGSDYFREPPLERISRDFSRHSDVIDRKYMPGVGGGEFDRPRRLDKEEERRLGGAPPERLSRDFNRHSDLIDRKYTPGMGGGEFERSRRPDKEDERRIGAGAPPERLRRDFDRHSNIVDTQKEYGGGLLQSYRGPDRDRYTSDNGRNEGYSRRSYQFDEDLSRVNRANLPVDEHRKPDGLKGSTDHFNEGLSRVDRWNHPLDEQKKLDGLKVSGDVLVDGSGVGGERDYFSRRYLEKYPSEQLLDNNPLSLEVGKEKAYSSYPLDVSVPPPKSFGINDGGSYGLTPAYPGTSLHKGKIYHLDGDSYLKDEYYVGPSVLPKEGHRVHSDGVGLSSEMMLNKQPLQYDGFGEKTLTESPLNPAGRSSDIRSYSRSNPILSEEKRGVYAYPGVGRGEEEGIRGSTLAVVGEDYSHRDMLRTTTRQDPIVGRMDQLSRGEHIRDNRPWDHHSYSRGNTTSKNYVDGVGSSYVRRDDVDGLGYGDTRLEYKREAYKDYGSNQPREPPVYGIGHDPWSHHDRSNMEYHDSPSRKLSAGDLNLPEPSRKILRRNSHEIPTSSNVRSACKIYDDHGKTGKRSRDVTSRLTPRNPSQSMSNLENKSVRSTRDIKSRLGPRPPHINERPSVKKRLGPRSQNVDGSQYVTKKYRSLLKQRLGPVP